MQSTPPHFDLSRRERQIMDVIHRHGRATVSEVMAELPDGPSYSAVRSALSLLRKKKVLRYEHDGKRYVYLPVMSPDEAKASALEHLLQTFFEGSQAQAVDAILSLADTELPEEELQRLETLIHEARSRGAE